MIPKEIKALFPIKVSITPEHRQLAMDRGGLHKLGNVLLELSLPTILHEDIFWGLSIGTVKGVNIKTQYEELFKDKLEAFPLYLDSSFKDNEVTFELRN
jgi:hypothetical protein